MFIYTKNAETRIILGFNINNGGMKLGHSKRNVQISYRRLYGGDVGIWIPAPAEPTYRISSVVNQNM